MKFLKTIILASVIAVFSLFASNAHSQSATWTKIETDGGEGYICHFTDMDSLYTPFYSDWSGKLSNIDNGTIYMTYQYTPGNTTVANDSIKLILQGKFDANTIVNVDTLSAVVEGTNGATVRYTTLTLASFSPLYRVMVEEITSGAATNGNWDDGVLYLGFYAKTPDAINEKKHFIDKY
jgi:hypothetical protein